MSIHHYRKMYYLNIDMPETKQNALRRAKFGGFPSSNVVRGKTGYFIAPKGIHSSGAKSAYASCRSNSSDKEKCAKIAWSVEKNNRG